MPHFHVVATDTGQLSIQLKEQGIRKVETNNTAWIDRMRLVAAAHCINHGTVTTEPLRHYADQNNDQPAHPNAWGAVFRGRQWQIVGYKKSKVPSCHGRQIAVWTYEP